MRDMLEIRGLSKTYVRSGETIRALRDVSLSAVRGDLVVVKGPSGSGKSTLLLMLGGMLRPSSGSVLVEGRDIYALSGSRRNRYRKFTVGFMFQRFFLVPYLTVRDNILLPLALRGEKGGAGGKIDALAERLRIDHRLGHMPSELSVGEQQRVAMARALAGDPAMILADEPTGNLDAGNTEIIAAFLEEESRRGRLVVMVTHDVSLTRIATKNMLLESGSMVSRLPEQ
jgi:putative ABC transport system ATP-binding protein